MLRERKAASRVSTSRTRILAGGPSIGGLARAAITVEVAAANVATAVVAGMAAGSKPVARITTPIYRKTARLDRRRRQAPIASGPDSVTNAGPTTRRARTSTPGGVANMAINKASREDNEAASSAARTPRADRAIISSVATAASARAAAGNGVSREARDPAAAAVREARVPPAAAASRG